MACCVGVAALELQCCTKRTYSSTENKLHLKNHASGTTSSLRTGFHPVSLVPKRKRYSSAHHGNAIEHQQLEILPMVVLEHRTMPTVFQAEGDLFPQLVSWHQLRHQQSLQPLETASTVNPGSVPLTPEITKQFSPVLKISAILHADPVMPAVGDNFSLLVSPTNIHVSEEGPGKRIRKANLIGDLEQDPA